MIDKVFHWVAEIHGGSKKVVEVVAEWHAFTQGLCEVMCPWPPRHKTMTKKLREEVESEHHYYVAGRVVGAVVLVLGLVGVVALVKGVIL